MRDFNKWHVRYLDLAKHIGSWSKDTTKIGAVVIDREYGQVMSQGYNGFARGVEDLPVRMQDRDVKLKYVIHAEMNCIYNASLTGMSLRDCMLYVDGLPPCSECAKGIIQAGISSVYMRFPQNLEGRWKESYALSKELLSEANVHHEIIL